MRVYFQLNQLDEKMDKDVLHIHIENVTKRQNEKANGAAQILRRWWLMSQSLAIWKRQQYIWYGDAAS